MNDWFADRRDRRVLRHAAGVDRAKPAHLSFAEAAAAPMAH